MGWFRPEEGEADPGPILARLVAERPELETLRVGMAEFCIVMRSEEEVRGGKRSIGLCALPRWQGRLAGLAAMLLAEWHGRMPDFLIVLDAGWWEGAAERDREALLFHELMHAWHSEDADGEPRFTADGLPVWGIREHDVTAFRAEVARYGAWHPDIADFLAAARENRVAGGGDA